jgi:hypothetical protein
LKLEEVKIVRKIAREITNAELGSTTNYPMVQQSAINIPGLGITGTGRCR